MVIVSALLRRVASGMKPRPADAGIIEVRSVAVSGSPGYVVFTTGRGTIDG